MKSDYEIQKDVMEELRWEPGLYATEIGVAVKDGIVTLSGTVDSFAKKIAAERAATKVAGVKAVAEDIEVKIFSGLKKNDTEIAQAIANALKWNSSVNENKIKVKVDNGWVTLEGEVEWEFQKNSAKTAIENLLGVRGISNLIQVTPRAKMSEVKQKITAAFQRHASLDASKVHVETIVNKVILTGKVRSLAEKRDAEDAAWAAPGVTMVDNKIEVDYAEALVAY
jgi:osmotically-inducible protein OsmY